MLNTLTKIRGHKVVAQCLTQSHSLLVLVRISLYFASQTNFVPDFKTFERKEFRSVRSVRSIIALEMKFLTNKR